MFSFLQVASFLSRLLDFAFRRREARSEPKPEAPANDAPAPAPAPARSGAERRRWPRVPVELQARIRFASTEAAIRSHTFDISPGGTFLQLRHTRPQGTKVKLTLEIGERTVIIQGVVARVSDGTDGPKGVGIAFNDVDLVDQLFLEEICEKRKAGRRGT